MKSLTFSVPCSKLQFLHTGTLMAQILLAASGMLYMLSLDTQPDVPRSPAKLISSHANGNERFAVGCCRNFKPR